MGVQRGTVLATDRLVVTTWVPGDLDDLCELHSDAETMRFVGPGRPETRVEVRRRLSGYLDEQAVRGWTKWRVADRDGAMVGRAGFGVYGGFRDLSYVLGRRHWGRGLGTELATALRDWHWRNLDPDRPRALSAFTAEENHASRRILEKVGFRFVDAHEYAGEPCLFYRCSGENGPARMS
jgi:RimJ/RimL family protein N-acetyltransferase